MDTTTYRPSERSWRNAAPVRQRDGRRARALWFALTGILAALAPLVFYLVQTNRYTDTRYRLNDVRAGIDAAREEERHLRTRCATLETLPRVERAAVALGLGPAPIESVVMVQTGSPAIGNLMARAPDSRDLDAR